MEACLEMQLIYTNYDNICAVHEKHQSLVSSASSLPPRDACPPQQRPLLPMCDGPLSKAMIVERYSDAFTGIGNLDGEIHLETDPSVPPVQMPPRSLPEPIKNEVKQEFDALCQNKIIAPVNAPTAWVSALLVVKKPNGKARICTDPRPLNKAMKCSNYHMPTINDVLPQLAKARIYSTVDVRSGFWNVKLDTESSLLTTFETPFARYRWLCLPQSVSPAP